MGCVDVVREIKMNGYITFLVIMDTGVVTVDSFVKQSCGHSCVYT